MNTWTFDDLLSKLPDCDKFPLSDSSTNGVSYINSATPKFVHPDLSNLESGDRSSSTQALVVSAPGAVGKSTLAKEIAFRKGALLWDLALSPEVGGGSLDGTILQSLSATYTEDYLEYMNEGLQFLIVDALDEGRMKVNENSFQRLLDDIGQRAIRSKAICFVLLGRTRIAETAWLVLDDLGVNTSMISIEAFDRDQANTYIDNNVGSDKRTDAFYDCRDLIFQQLAFSVAETDESDIPTEFLHYPPVLDVVATLLREEPNLFRLKNSLPMRLSGTEDRAILLLDNVIGHILEREQEKVLPAIKDSLIDQTDQLGWYDWKALYSSEEQCKRLLGSVLNNPVQAVPDTLPQTIGSLYANCPEVTIALSEHPFLQGVDKFANRVFESYLYSRALRDEFGSDLKQLVTEDLLRLEHLPTSLLAAFYLASSTATPDMAKEIMPEHLGIIYSSLISSESSRSVVRLHVDGPDPLVDSEEASEPVEVDFEFLTFDLQGNLQTPIPDPVTFALPVHKNSRLSFANNLKDANISVPCVVELGTTGRDVTIGPAVNIAADKIVMRSETLTIKGQTKLNIEDIDDRIILEARVCDWTSITKPLMIYDENKFHVSWPDAERYPWTLYGFKTTSRYILRRPKP